MSGNDVERNALLYVVGITLKPTPSIVETLQVISYFVQNRKSDLKKYVQFV